MIRENQQPTRSHEDTKKIFESGFASKSSALAFLRVFVASCWLLVSFSVAFAQEQPTPAATVYQDANQAAPEAPATLSQPAAIPTESNEAPSAGQKPSQGEGEKAPVTSRPTAVPQFSLPEVVITGENELTISAQRLDRKANDVTLGSHDLTGVERAINDLPGLNKTFTALATEESGPPQGTALVMHLGGGTPNTYGGWGLFGQEFKDFQYLLSGYDSNWGGEPTATGFDGDKRYGYGGRINLFPLAPQNLLLSGDFNRVDAELPYQNSIRETHDGVNLNLEGHWKFSDLTQAQLNLTNQDTFLNYWDASAKTNQTQEWEGHFKLTADDLGDFLNRFSADAGLRHANSDFTAPSAAGYDWGWVGIQGYFKSGENLGLTLKAQAQAGDGLDLPLKVYPEADFLWRVFGNTQLNLYWKSDRYVESFNKTFIDEEHVSPEEGFPSPTEVTYEWGGRFTQKLTEAVVLSLSASTAQIQGYHQWTDINAVSPVFIQNYSTLAQVQLNKAAANLQWNFMKDWQATATYQWTQGLNQGGTENLTNLPMNRGIFSVYRGDDTFETRLELQVASERQAFASLPGTLPAYATLGLDATYHLSKTFSLWFNGDNLLGQAFDIQPGYLEPKYHIRGGIEVIF